MFVAVAFAMILTQMVGVVATIIDGVITSRFVGSVQYSAISLLGPFISVIYLLVGSISNGNQIVSSKSIGKGKREDANASFTYSLIVSIVICLLVILACVFFPSTLFRICGVSLKSHEDLYPHMLRYLHGIMPGIPFMILIQVTSPMVILDGGRNRFTISSLVFCVTDIAADLINVFVFHGDEFGMGLATSLSFAVQFLILVSHFLGNRSYFRISFRGIRRSLVSEVSKAGSPTTVRKLFTTLRDLTINRINLYVAISSAAIAARGMQNDLNTLMFCISLGMGGALISMTGIYFGAEDRHGLRNLFAFSMRFALTVSCSAGVVLLFAAPVISRFYTSDPEVLEMSVFSIRCMAIGLPLDTLAVSYQSFLLGTRRAKLVNGMSFFERFVIPVLSAMYLARLFGSKGVMASLAVSKVMLVFVMLVIIIVKNRHFPRNIYEWMLTSMDFGGSDEENLYVRIDTMEDVVKARDDAEKFCLDKGIDPKRALYAALFIEEMAGNVVLHGKRRGSSPISADFRLFIRDGKISITLRDYCKQFDPERYLAQHEGDEKAIGIRMVKMLASEFTYFNAFNSNNLLIVM